MLKFIVKRSFCTNNSKYQNNLELLFERHTKTLKQPFFLSRAGNIEILKDPIDFYIALHVILINQITLFYLI